MNSNKYKSLILFLAVCFSVQIGIAQEKQISLDEAKAMALENNKSIKKAEQNINAAKAAKASAYTANKPSLSASAIGLYLADPLNTLLPESSLNNTIDLTQVIYAGGKINAAKKITSSLVDLQNEQKNLTTSEVLLKTETAYWQLIQLKEKKVLAKEYLKLLETLYTDLNNYYKAGLIYKNDVLKVQVTLNEAQLSLIKVLDGYTMAKLSFAQIIGLNDTNFDINNEGLDSYSSELLSNIKDAVENRSEISILKKSVTVQELQSNLLKADRRPTVALSATGLYSIGKEINFSNRDDNMKSFYGLVSVNIPLFDWGGRKQKVKEQEYKVEAQKLTLDETKEFLALEIQNAYFELNQSIKNIELTQKSLEQAKENLRLYEDRLKAGTVVGKDVLEAQVLWQKAYSNAIDAKAAYKISSAKYHKAIGSLK